jgi:hypothetical protein
MTQFSIFFAQAQKFFANMHGTTNNDWTCRSAARPKPVSGACFGSVDTPEMCLEMSRRGAVQPAPASA